MRRPVWKMRRPVWMMRRGVWMLKVLGPKDPVPPGITGIHNG